MNNEKIDGASIYMSTIYKIPFMVITDILVTILLECLTEPKIAIMMNRTYMMLIFWVTYIAFAILAYVISKKIKGKRLVVKQITVGKKVLYIAVLLMSCVVVMIVYMIVYFSLLTNGIITL